MQVLWVELPVWNLPLGIGTSIDGQPNAGAKAERGRGNIVGLYSRHW